MEWLRICEEKNEEHLSEVGYNGEMGPLQNVRREHTFHALGKGHQYAGNATAVHMFFREKYLSHYENSGRITMLSKGILGIKYHGFVHI